MFNIFAWEVVAGICWLIYWFINFLFHRSYWTPSRLLRPEDFTWFSRFRQISIAWGLVHMVKVKQRAASNKCQPLLIVNSHVAHFLSRSSMSNTHGGFLCGFWIIWSCKFQKLCQYINLKKSVCKMSDTMINAHYFSEWLIKIAYFLFDWQLMIQLKEVLVNTEQNSLTVNINFTL